MKYEEKDADWQIGMNKELEEEIEATLRLILDPRYVYGLVSGAAAFILLLMRLQGWSHTLDNGQVHLSTLLWICIIFIMAYAGFEDFHPPSRFVLALAFVLLIFYVHDTLWLASTIPRGMKIGGAYVPTSPTFYVSVFSRNFVFLFASFLVLRKHICLGYKPLAIIGVDVAYWAIVTYLEVGGVFPFPLVTLFIDTLPAFGLLHGEK